MSEYTAHNVESEVLKSATDKLQRTFRNSLKTLAGKFYAENLIPTEVWRNCSDSTIDKDTSTEALVSALQDRVSNEQSAYYSIVKILESETGVSYIVKGMEEKRKELEVIETEKKEEFERKKAELKNLNLQETSSHAKLFYLQERPYNLPETPPLMRSTTAPSRNAPTSSFPQSHSGPAMYNRSFPTASSWSQNSSSTQAGDTFPLPASSPGEMNSWILRPNILKTPFQTLPQPVNAFGTEQAFRHNLVVTGMGPVGSQEYEYRVNRGHQTELALPDNQSMNTHHPSGVTSDNDQNSANRDQLKNDLAEIKMEKQSKDRKEPLCEETCQLSDKKPNEDVTEQNKSRDKVFSKSAPIKDITIDLMQLPQRSDSTCSNTSENSCESFGTPNSSMSLKTSGETMEDLQRAQAKSCSKCAFFKKELQRLDEKVAELEKKCEQKDNDLQRQQLHYNEQVKVFTSELQGRDYYLTAVNHRHQVMASKVAELQERADRVLGLEATIKLQEEEISTLKLERDRERRQKEMAMQQKETERKHYESERECRLAFETEVYQLRIELKRTRSFQCKENIFYYSGNDLESLAAWLQSNHLSSSVSSSYCTGTNNSMQIAAIDQSAMQIAAIDQSAMQIAAIDQSVLPGNNQSLHQGHSQGLNQEQNQALSERHNQGLLQGHIHMMHQEHTLGMPQKLNQMMCQGYAAMPHGHYQGMPHGQNQSMPQGYNQGMPQGYNQGMPHGQNQGMPQWQNQGMPQWQNQGMPHGQNQGMPHGRNQGMPQGQNQGMPQGYNQGMPQGHNQGLPQGHNQGMPHGQYQGLPQGHNQGILQGENQIMPQGPNQSMPQGQNQGMPKGHSQCMSHEYNQGMCQGPKQSIPQGHNQSMPQEYNQGLPQGLNQSTVQQLKQSLPLQYGEVTNSKPNPAFHKLNNENSGTIAAFSQQMTTTFPGEATSYVNGQIYPAETHHIQSATVPSKDPAESTLTTHPQRPAYSATTNGEAIEVRSQ